MIFSGYFDITRVYTGIISHCLLLCHVMSPGTWPYQAAQTNLPMSRNGEAQLVLAIWMRWHGEVPGFSRSLKFKNWRQKRLDMKSLILHVLSPRLLLIQTPFFCWQESCRFDDQIPTRVSWIRIAASRFSQSNLFCLNRYFSWWKLLVKMTVSEHRLPRLPSTSWSSPSLLLKTQ